VTDAQTWMLIGGFLTILVAMIGLVLRAVRLEIEVLRKEMIGGFEVIGVKVDNIDRDVQALIKKVFHQEGS
jgi:hypothetical protein